jgi:hypothetical protein
MVRHHPSRILATLATAVLISLVAACSGAAETPSATAQPTSAPLALGASPAPSASQSVAPSAGTSAAPRKTKAPASTKPAATKAPTKTATKAPTGTPAPNPKAVTGRIAVTESGFAITLPKNWRRIPLDGTEFAEFAADLPANSQWAKIFETQAGQAILHGIKFWAADMGPTAIAEGFPSNVTALVQDGAVHASIKAFGTVVVAQMQSLEGVSHVKQTVVTLPAGEALRVTYDLTMQVQGNNIDVTGLEFVILGADKVYAITFTCSPDNTSCTKTADTTMRTFAYLD